MTTCAVDASQIASNRNREITVGLVQIGWFVNPHDGSAPYQKAVQVEALTPEELVLEEVGIDDGEIEWRRWSGEVRCAMQFMRAHAGQRALVFIDALWLADWRRSAPTPREQWTRWALWQYTNGVSGLEPHSVNGISRVDRDVFNGTLEQLEQFWNC